MFHRGSKHSLFSVILATVALPGLCLTGCAGASEVVKEAHEYEDVEFQQQFIEDRKRCQDQGRTIIISGDGARLNRHGIPRSRVNYYCATIKGFE